MIKKNVQAFQTWKEANESNNHGFVCVLFAYNEFKEPRFIKVKHLGEIFTMNKAIPFSSDGQYFMCVSTKLKDTSLTNFDGDAKALAQRNDLLNPLLQKWFYGVSEWQKMPTSAVLVKVNLGDAAMDNVTGYRLVDCQETILQDMRVMVQKHNHIMAIINVDTLDKWKRPYL